MCFFTICCLSICRLCIWYFSKDLFTYVNYLFINFSLYFLLYSFIFCLLCWFFDLLLFIVCLFVHLLFVYIQIYMYLYIFRLFIIYFYFHLFVVCCFIFAFLDTKLAHLLFSDQKILLGKKGSNHCNKNAKMHLSYEPADPRPHGSDLGAEAALVHSLSAVETSNFRTPKSPKFFLAKRKTKTKSGRNFRKKKTKSRGARGCGGIDPPRGAGRGGAAQRLRTCGLRCSRALLGKHRVLRFYAVFFCVRVLRFQRRSRKRKRFVFHVFFQMLLPKKWGLINFEFTTGQRARLSLLWFNLHSWPHLLFDSFRPSNWPMRPDECKAFSESNATATRRKMLREAWIDLATKRCENVDASMLWVDKNELWPLVIILSWSM